MPDGSLSIVYSDPLGIYEPAVTYALGSNVRFGDLALSQAAELGEPAMSTVDVEDPGGIRNIVGLRAMQFKETAAPSNNQIVLRGVIQDRTYKRSDDHALITGADRLISVDVADYNWHLGARILVDADAKRPAESPGDRIRWLLSNAAHINLEDYGNVTYPTSPTLDANDYRGQRPKDLLADCAVEGQYNFWCDYNEAHGKPELFFMDPGSTDYASSLRVSNYLYDVDGSTVFAPYDAELRRSPTRITFGAYVAYSGGSVYVRNDTVGLQYAKLDQTAPMANVKTAARARRIGNKFLAKNDEESDRLSFDIKVPAAQVNDIRHGHRLLVKFSHLPGYEDDYHWVRVIQRGVIQEDEGGEDYYRIHIEAVPSGDGTGDQEVVSRGTSGGIMVVCSDDLSVGVRTDWEVDWQSEGLAAGLRDLDYTAFSYHYTTSQLDGFTVVATSGTLDLRAVFDCIWAHTGHGDITFTGSIQKNGADVATQSLNYPATGSFGFEQPSFDITASDVAVSAGDVLTVHLVSSSALGITIPAGTGVGTFFEILNTSTVTG